jgi:NADPH:quinone reductase-like Zn-dependent oxidoreductase
LGYCLAEGATLVNYGAMSGKPIVMPPGYFIARDTRLTGFWLARWYRLAGAERIMQVMTDLAELVASGKLTAPVQATYPLEEARTAIAAASSTERDGKILFEP